MSDAAAFFFTIGALYAIECLVLIPRCAVTIAPAGGRPHVAGANGGFGSRRSALVLVPPLSPWRPTFIVPLAPVSLGPRGVLGYAAHAFNPGTRPESSCVYVPYDSAREARAVEGTVDVRGEALARLGSPRAARFWAGWIRRLASAPPERREAAIAEGLRGHLDEREARRRLGAYAAATRGLRIAGAAVLVVLLAGVPGAIAWRGLAATWPWLLAAVLVAHAAAVASALHARAVLRRSGIEIPASRLVPVCLSPVSAARAADALGRDLAADLHPLAVAAAVLGPDRSGELAARILRDLAAPVRPVPELADEAAAAEFSFRGALTAEVRRLSQRLGAPAPRAPERAPGAADGALCPRCEMVYRAAATACADCGVDLRPIAP